VSLAQTRRTRCRWIVTIGADVDTGMRQVPNQGSSFMQKREFARKRAEEVNLPELPDLLELAFGGDARSHVRLSGAVGSEPAARFGCLEHCCTGQSICVAAASAQNRRRIFAAVFVSVAWARDRHVPGH
jgi:hypothetical protein